MRLLTEYIPTDHHMDCGHVIGAFVDSTALAAVYFDTMGDSVADFSPSGSVFIVCCL